MIFQNYLFCYIFSTPPNIDGAVRVVALKNSIINRTKFYPIEDHANISFSVKFIWCDAVTVGNNKGMVENHLFQRGDFHGLR